MKDTDFYRHILGLTPPWTVTEVNLDTKEEQVDVWVGHPPNVKWKCPICNLDLSLYDHSEERVWRHLDTCQFQTFLHASPPRIKCPEHGVRQVRLPWAEDKSRFTALFEHLAIDLLQECSVSGAAYILRISWDEAHHIMDSAVKRGLLRKDNYVPSLMGIDEKASARGHKYMTIVADIEEGTVDHVGDERKKESVDKYFKSKSKEQLTEIDAIAVDMWEPYIQAIKDNVPDADDKIVFDKFHVVRYLENAVDEVRKEEHRELSKSGDSILTNTKYLWLYNEENIPQRRKDHFKQIKSKNLKTSRAWAIKETFRSFWDYTYTASAKKFWKSWYFWATHSRLKPIVKAAKTLSRHIKNILTYFKHPITNATSEGINSKIQTIKKKAYGFRNDDHFKTAIYFHCGGLNLYPGTHGKV
jgi:transposase